MRCLTARQDWTSPMPESFWSTVSADATAVKVTVAGEIDLLTAPRLAEALDDALARTGLPVIVELDDVTFCDSAGMHVLLRGTRQARLRHRELTITGAAAHVLRAFQLAGVAGELRLVDVTRRPARDA
jgi:anti-sigma B factor antagonist